MEIDTKTLSALARALEALETETQHPVPAKMVAALAEIARPGLRLKVDVAASRHIGAPLVTVSQAPHDTALLNRLTKRQKQVAKLLLKGQANRQIAGELGISVATVKDHVHAILKRLNMPTRAAMIAASRGVSKA